MKLYLIAILVMSFHAYGKTESFALPKSKPFKINIPDGWRAVPSLFGIPLAILGPEARDKRPVLSVYPGETNSKVLSQADLESLFADFKQEKEKWMKEEGGELKTYEPVTKVSFGKNVSGHYIGAEYVLEGETFLERSYYLYCKEELYNLKYTFRNDQLSHLKAAQQMVENFQCD